MRKGKVNVAQQQGERCAAVNNKKKYKGNNIKEKYKLFHRRSEIKPSERTLEDYSIPHQTVKKVAKNASFGLAENIAKNYFETGYPTAAGMNISQDNIRDIQMAKAAIRAAVELLLMCYGIRAEELEQVYLAGGMGYYLDPQHALDIGLLPAG